MSTIIHVSIFNWGMGLSNGKLALVTCHTSSFTYLFQIQLQYNRVSLLSEPLNSEVVDSSQRKKDPDYQWLPIYTSSFCSNSKTTSFCEHAQWCGCTHSPCSSTGSSHPQIQSSFHYGLLPHQVASLVTLTSLSWFLCHAENEIGNGEAMAYEAPLQGQAFELDILHKVSDMALEALSIPGRHIIHTT